MINFKDYILDALVLSILLNIYFIGTITFKFLKMEKQEQLILTFLKGRDCRTVARTNEGKICLLDIPYCKENHIYVKEGEDWRCAVKEAKQNALIVQPITRLLTAEENADIMGGKLSELADKYKNIPHQ